MRHLLSRKRITELTLITLVGLLVSRWLSVNYLSGQHLRMRFASYFSAPHSRLQKFLPSYHRAMNLKPRFYNRPSCCLSGVPYLCFRAAEGDEAHEVSLLMGQGSRRLGFEISCNQGRQSPYACQAFQLLSSDSLPKEDPKRSVECLVQNPRVLYIVLVENSKEESTIISLLNSHTE